MNKRDPMGTCKKKIFEKILEYWQEFLDLVKRLFELNTTSAADAVTVPLSVAVDLAIEALMNGDVIYGASANLVLEKMANEAAIEGDIDKAMRLRGLQGKFTDILNKSH